MKNQIKFHFILVFCIASLSANAQIEKGKKIIGLGLSFYNDKEDNTLDRIAKETSSNLSTSLSGAYLVSNSLSIDLGVEYSHYTSKNTDYVPGFYRKSVNNGFSPNVFVKYFKNISGQFYYSPKATVYISNYKSESFYKQDTATPETSSTSKTNSAEISLSPMQFGFLINNKFFIELSFATISYENQKNTSNSGIYNYQTVNSKFQFDLPTNYTQVSFSMLF